MFDNKIADKRILITGGLGFIGSNLARTLVDAGAIVTIVDSLIVEYGGNLHNLAGYHDRLRVNISDVRDRHSLRSLISGQDYLFNLAGQTSHMDSMTNPFADLEINCKAQLTILETCRECNPDIQIVFASTRQLYGKPTYLPVDEMHLLRPVDVNGINKMAGEWYHILYNNVYGIRSSALRLTNTYGPRMRIKDARQTFLGIWIRLLLEGKTFEVWEGSQLRDFTFVDDAVDALILTALSPESYGKVMNVGGDCVISLIDLAKLLVEVYGSGEFVSRQFPSDRKRIDIGDYYADDSMLKGLLGWEPKIDLRVGLSTTLDYFKTNFSHYI